MRLPAAPILAGPDWTPYPWLVRGALVLIATLVFTTGCDRNPRPDRDSRSSVLLADVSGSIDLAVLVVNSPRRSGLRNQALVERAVTGLDEHTRFLLLAHREMILDPSPEPERMRFAEIPDDVNLSIWPQDPFVVLRDADGGPRLLAARGYGREDDSRMTSIVADAMGWPIEESALFFAGGNIVSDAERAFVGTDLIRENAAELGWSEQQVRDTFRRELGRPIHVVGVPPQPVAHIDVIVTPLGDGRIAVADSAAGAAIAESALAVDPAAVRAFEREAEEYFFGHPDLTEITDTEGNVWRAPPIVGVTEAAVGDSRAVAPALDAIADDLEGIGYSVVRVPLLLRRQGRPEQLLSPRGSAGYPLLSYNNVLVETVGGRRAVYLPAYGFPALDDAARAVWQDAGFETRPIRGATTSAMYRGSLRCAIKVLSRGP